MVKRKSSKIRTRKVKSPDYPVATDPPLVTWKSGMPLGDPKLLRVVPIQQLNYTFLHEDRLDRFLICQEIDWFVTLCPIDNFSDLCNLTINYMPDEKIIDNLCLDAWSHSLRNTRIFTEVLIREITDFLFKSVSPYYMEVIGNFNKRCRTTLFCSKVKDQFEFKELAKQRTQNWNFQQNRG